METKESCLILIRGLPGSGKTTLARVICDLFRKMHHVENDMYRLRENGEYSFDEKDNEFVRESSLADSSELLKNGNSVVVSNVFTSADAMRMYTELPYRKIIIRVTGNYGSVYDIPDDKLTDMVERFEDVAGEIILGDLNAFTISDLRRVINGTVVV